MGNFLCDSKPGTDHALTGPSGKVMLIPESNPNADLIMVATGTGIAPYRSFIRRLFVEDTPYGNDYKGLAWLFLGVANTDALLTMTSGKRCSRSSRTTSALTMRSRASRPTSMA